MHYSNSSNHKDLLRSKFNYQTSSAHQLSRAANHAGSSNMLISNERLMSDSSSIDLKHDSSAKQLSANTSTRVGNSSVYSLRKFDPYDSMNYQNTLAKQSISILNQKSRLLSGKLVGLRISNNVQAEGRNTHKVQA